MAERIGRDDAGAAPARGGPTLLGELITDSWLPIKRRHVRATTAYRYAWFVDRYINPAIGQVPVRRLRADHLDGLYDQLANTGGRNGDGLAPKTVHEVHVIVRSSLDVALRRHLVDTKVAQATNARHKRQTRKVPEPGPPRSSPASPLRPAPTACTQRCT
jgi:hypothetical protein